MEVHNKHIALKKKIPAAYDGLPEKLFTCF